MWDRAVALNPGVSNQVASGLVFISIKKNTCSFIESFLYVLDFLPAYLQSLSLYGLTSGQSLLFPTLSSTVPAVVVFLFASE